MLAMQFFTYEKGSVLSFMNIEKLYLKREEVDDMRTLYEILLHAKEKYPEKIAYQQFETRTDTSEINFRDFADSVEQLRAAMLAEGLSGKHVAIWGESSFEWLSVYLATVSGIGVAVPVDKELRYDTIVTQLSFADVDTVFCSKRCLKKLLKVLPECPQIKKVYLMRSDDVSEVSSLADAAPLASLYSKGKELITAGSFSPAQIEIDPDKLALIIFTSGTTGANKGVMLSNRNVLGTLRGCARLLRYPSTSISVLPINHSYELHAHLMSCLYCGTTVFFNDDLKHLLKNLESDAPEMSCMVPVMLDLIVKKLKVGIKDSGKEEQFNKLVSVSNALLKHHIDVRQKIFSKILKPLGGNLKMVICGGAALSQDTIDFLTSIGVKIYNGYGITECAPVAAVNPLAKARRFSVGHVLPTEEVRIADPDENGNGEIQFRGDNVMLGYYKAPSDTEAVFTNDGWFRTGDIGHKDNDNYLYISGRLKNLIILSNGKNIFPEEIEEHLLHEIPYIKECVVFADDDGTGIYAICYLDPDFCSEHGLDSSEAKRAFLQKDVQLFNKDMPGFKRLTDVVISEAEFEKNTTKKIQRFKIKAVINKDKKGESVNV